MRWSDPDPEKFIEVVFIEKKSFDELSEYLEMFSRQIIMRDFGLENQLKLREKSILVVGSGALGSAISILMTRSGVKRIRIIDSDEVELSNIPRTLSYVYRDAGNRTPKAYALARSLKEVFPDIEVDYRIDNIDVDNILDLLRDVDIVLDGLDNLETRFIVNEASVITGKPYVYSAVEGFYGVVMPVIPGETACFRCIYTPSTEILERRGDPCNVIGVSVLTVVATASIASKLAIDLLLGRSIDPKIYYIDMRRLEIGSLGIQRNPRCPVCGLREYEFIGKKSPREILAKCSKENMYQIKLPRPVSREDLERISKHMRTEISEDEFRYVIQLGEKDHYRLELYKNSRMGLVIGLPRERVAEILETLRKIL